MPVLCSSLIIRSILFFPWISLDVFGPSLDHTLKMALGQREAWAWQLSASTTGVLTLHPNDTPLMQFLANMTCLKAQTATAPCVCKQRHRGRDCQCPAAQREWRTPHTGGTEHSEHFSWRGEPKCPGWDIGRAWAVRGWEKGNSQGWAHQG